MNKKISIILVIILVLGFATQALASLTLSATGINMTGSTSGSLTLEPAAVTTSYTLTLPADDGTSGQFLQTNGSGVTTWATGATGDVVGPASATDNAIVRFDSTTGKLVQNSSATIDDSGNITAPSVVTSGTINTTRPYKVYVALLTQSGTSAPTATVLENTLGGTVVWTRASTGQYTGTLTGAFPADKTAFFALGGLVEDIDTSWIIHGLRLSDDTVRVRTGLNTWQDDALNKAAIEIRVYP